MNIDWGDYKIYRPGVVGPLNTLPRAEARIAYQKMMTEKHARVSELKGLLKANRIDLGTDDSSVQILNGWFQSNVEEDPERLGRLLPQWYSVVNDIGIFLGEIIIERHPHLRWEFYIWGKKNVAFQRHVIMGFTAEDAKFHTNLDIDAAVAVYAHRIIDGQEVEPDAFWRWLKGVEARA
jgi:hypothetical protein